MQRRKNNTPKKEIQSLLTNSDPKNKLPLLHVTPVGNAREILEAGQLEARFCKVFDRKLLYFFIARPAYSLKGGDEKTDQISRFPFVFLINPNGVKTPFHVFPFDTGGAATGIFDKVADPFVFLEDYELKPDIRTGYQMMEWAFGNTLAYLNGEINSELSSLLPVHNLTAQSYVKIAKMASSFHNDPESYDSRASAIEVASQEHIKLKNNVLLAIIPKQFLEETGKPRNERVIDLLGTYGINWKVYDWQPNRSPNDFSSEIRFIVERHLKDNGQI